jgi:hypothetical protein
MADMLCEMPLAAAAASSTTPKAGEIAAAMAGKEPDSHSVAIGTAAEQAVG